MQNVLSNRNLYLLLAAFLLGAATLGGSAMFAADTPGSDLVPVGNADELVEILQVNSNIMWSRLLGPSPPTRSRAGLRQTEIPNWAAGW